MTTKIETKFVPLPHSLRRTINGGCQCSHCKAHPHATPQWDVLAYDANMPGNSWVIHYPEIAQHVMPA
jgi:hypothetical protein